ncbi:hypothetical protein AXK56_03335 [Tsukamurella pulmonis]|uniref:DUF6891 domain-containing protein n=1 Tax=Tsukamurella pulmonis TaxID=47312 RepID=A0A1H1E047_9ACTN|nr:hypothetical protein [Tsukamurella pulmonis]KXO92140.1 hypothetical protein AXK56_03335 [Tsukamurella pulmonis]SDQ81868.1 hypothetical protein SAMN04489765_1965 [Tsukamurella pulmonis]SUP21483.1 Uncharacterised protein [Tsukamurella pulmonis]
MIAPSNPNAVPDDAALPPLGLGAEDAEALRTEIWSLLVVGRDDPEEFAEYAAEEYDLSPEQLIAAFRGLREARIRQQAGFGGLRSRTTAAFAELAEHGILARGDFTCCGTCAAAEIGDERDESRHWSGYVYFHSQDTEGLIETGSTYIGYGAFPPADFDEVAYADLSDAEKRAGYAADVTRMLDEVVFPVLRRHGIEPEWNRDLGTRVLLANADWYVPIGPGA